MRHMFFLLKKISLDELPSPVLEIQNDLSQFLHNMSNLLLYWTFSGILIGFTGGLVFIRNCTFEIQMDVQ